MYESLEVGFSHHIVVETFFCIPSLVKAQGKEVLGVTNQPTRDLE